MLPDKNNKRKKEMRIYEILGVRIFQKMVFELEKLIHRKDGGQNENYHFQRNKEMYSENFIKYLFYNGSIHGRNLIYLLIIFLIMHICFKTSAFDIGIIFLGIKDIYCVMLQRYNYIRISVHVEKVDERNQKKKLKKIEKLKSYRKAFYDEKNREKDLLFIKRLKEEIANNSYVMINEGDVERIKRLSKLYYQKDS